MSELKGLLAAGALGLVYLAGSPAALAQTETTAQAPTTERSTPDLPKRRPEEARADPLRAFDIDKDGTLDLAEVKSAAAARYDELDPKLDDNMDQHQAASALRGAAFRQADTNHDSKLSKAEYLAYAERRFHATDHEGDGKLDHKELSSKAGQALMRLLR